MKAIEQYFLVVFMLFAQQDFSEQTSEESFSTDLRFHFQNTTPVTIDISALITRAWLSHVWWGIRVKVSVKTKAIL